MESLESTAGVLTPTLPRDSMLQPTLPREALTAAYGCSHAELGRLLRERVAPLPVRIEGTILWYKDEVEASKTKVQKLLERRKRH